MKLCCVQYDSHLSTEFSEWWIRRHRRFWHATQDCVEPYVNHILYRDRFWAISIVWFRQCEIMRAQILLYGAQPCDMWASSWSPPVLWRESWQDLLGICVIVHTRNVSRKGHAMWLVYCSDELRADKCLCLVYACVLVCHYR